MARSRAASPPPPHPAPVNWRGSRECRLQSLGSLSTPSPPPGQWILRTPARAEHGPAPSRAALGHAPRPGGRREGWEPRGRRGAAKSGRGGVKQGAGAGRGGSGGWERRESESGGGLAGEGGTGAKEHPVPAAGCAPGEEVVRGGAGGREARGGERSGLRPPHRGLFLWGRLSQCFRRVSPRPHVSAGVTSYREAPESGSRAGVSASWGRDGLESVGSTSGHGRHPQPFA